MCVRCMYLTEKVFESSGRARGLRGGLDGGEESASELEAHVLTGTLHQQKDIAASCGECNGTCALTWSGGQGSDFGAFHAS